MNRSADITIESVALWCLASVPLAVLIALAVAPLADPAGLMIWVGAKLATAVVAVFGWTQRDRAQWPLPLARVALVLSALCWGSSGILFGSFDQAMYNLPVQIAVAGVASAAVWMFGRQLWLVITVLVLVLTPALFHLVLGSRADWAAAAIIVFLVIANLLVSRRVAMIMATEAGSASSAGAVSARPSSAGEPLSGARLNALAQKELDEMRAELERRRNLEGELNAARQAAESAAMAKGEFLATMSHEMRTPLNGIIPLLEILRDTRLEPDQREYLNTAYQSARHLLRIIDDILDYSKIEAGKLELETTGINLREVTDSVVRLMEKNAEAKGVRLSSTIDPGVRLAVRGDPVRLRQVLANLVSNGIKFTDKGTVTIQVSKRGETRTHSELLFVVRDTGLGIDPVVAEKLFRPFSQADASTTRNYGGTGLGLVICKRIVNLMDGKIGLKSELGKGSIFWFSIPMLKAIGDMASARRTLDGARALIVSSDQRLVQRLSTYLQSWGLAQISTNTTADALSKLKSSATLGENWAFDVCLVDFASMRNTAPALVRNVVREPVLERLKLVYLAVDEPIPADVQVAGRSEAIDKVFSEGDLQSVFNRVLEIDQPGEKRYSLIEQAQRMGAESAPSSPAVQVAGPLTGHVLLVEDNPVNRQVAQKLLSLIGLSHDHAENGKLALEMAGQTAYDAVLMDCQMPVMDGYTATRTRRMLEDERSLHRLPIIAMTANAMAGDREKCLAAGMDDYLSKPLNRGLLEQTLRKWLPGDARSQKGTPSPKTAPVPTPEAVIQSEPIKLRERGPPIDEQIVTELLEVMGSEFTALVRVYLEDTPKNLKALDKAAEMGEAQGMIAPAHSLKSTSANLGAMGLSDIAKQIEHSARQGTLKDPLPKAREATVEFQRVAEALEQLLKRVGD